MAMLLVLCIVTVPLTGCKKKQLTEKQYEELAQKQAEKNKKKVILRATFGTNTYEITVYDALYYLAYNEKSALDVKNEQDTYYKTVYGDDYDFWNIANSDGVKIKDGYKENAYATIVYTNVFYNEAKEAGMELEEIRRIRIEPATASFLAGFTPEQRAKCGMTEACIRENYEKVFLANQYVEKMTEEYKVDEEAVRATIDKEDYRVYETDYLFVPKSGLDENFHRVEFTPEESEKRKNAINDALERVKSGEQMADVRQSYDEFMTLGSRDIYRTTATIEPAYVDASVALAKGDSVMIESESSYYIIYMLDNTQFVGYEEAVAEAITDAESVGVGNLYQQKADRYNFAKTEEWDTITFGDFAIIKK